MGDITQAINTLDSKHIGKFIELVILACISQIIICQVAAVESPLSRNNRVNCLRRREVRQSKNKQTVGSSLQQRSAKSAWKFYLCRAASCFIQ